VLVDGGHYPVDAWVVADRVVSDVHTDHLKVFVRSVLSNPVGVQYSETTNDQND
jgi:hypothetical protein